ncbi:MAG: NnrU family protein [Gammaproteobacteria bacterium]|nr:MAG: NnrU family protein [Gammaproteobacteria bacterium]PIE36456.1 MAG: NnrU family protein [Gammaproteobacteria bacterium]
MMDWFEFIFAFITFFATHSLPLRPPVRSRLTRLLGERGFQVVYSVLSLAILAWLIVAAGRAPFVLLWAWSPWQGHATLSIMALACLILAVSIGTPNPFSFGGARNALYTPQRPGIVRLTRHPLLLALALWSLAHLIVNGDLAHVILFGTFAAFSALGGRLVDRRRKRELGDSWETLWVETRSQPLGAIRAALDIRRLALGVALFLLLLWAHPLVIGVSPLT